MSLASNTRYSLFSGSLVLSSEGEALSSEGEVVGSGVSSDDAVLSVPITDGV